MKTQDYINQFKKHLLEGDFAIQPPSINLYADSLEVDDIIDAMTRAELVAYFRMILSNGLKKLALMPDCNPFPIDFDNPPKMGTSSLYPAAFQIRQKSPKCPYRPWNLKSE